MLMYILCAAAGGHVDVRGMCFCWSPCGHHDPCCCLLLWANGITNYNGIEGCYDNSNPQKERE